jgi:hypothetical protein
MAGIKSEAPFNLLITFDVQDRQAEVQQTTLPFSFLHAMSGRHLHSAPIGETVSILEDVHSHSFFE